MAVHVARSEPHCGVRHYAEALRASTPRGEWNAVVVPHRDMPGLQLRPTDVLVVHFELVSTLRDGRALWQTLRNWNRMGIAPARKLVLLHSVHSKGRGLVRGLLFTLQRVILRRVAGMARLACVSEDGVRALRELGFDATFIPHGVFQRKEARAKCGGPRRIGVIGHPYGFKGYSRAIRTFSALPERVRGRYLLVRIGGDARVDRAEDLAIRRALAELPDAAYEALENLTDDEFEAAVAGLDLAFMPYEDRMQGSAVLSLITAYGIPAVVSSAAVFGELVKRNGAVVVRDWNDAGELAMRLEEAARCRALDNVIGIQQIALDLIGAAR